MLRRALLAFLRGGARRGLLLRSHHHCRRGVAQSIDALLPEGSSVRTLTVDGVERSYRAYRPAGIDRPVPLVLVFHGLGGGADAMEQALGWNEAADRDGFVVVYPDGVDHSFNAGELLRNRRRNTGG